VKPVLAAEIGSLALWLTYAWLLSAIAASYLSARKGYGEKIGLASGLLLTVLGVLIWLVWPAKPQSRWKLQGPIGSRGETVAEARAKLAAEGGEGDPQSASRRR
jgi:hypothetical protein